MQTILVYHSCLSNMHNSGSSFYGDYDNHKFLALHMIFIKYV